MPDISFACELLEKGELIGLPTETVYGLAADAFNVSAAAKIYEKKRRPHLNPLIVHGHSLEQLMELGRFSKEALILAETFWPGPLTLVVPRHKHCPLDYLISAGMESIALRIPSHPIALEILKTYDKPLAAPSANISNSLSPTSKQMVLKDFPDLYVVDGGPCNIGLESTIIGMNPDPVLLRPGGIPSKAIEEVLGCHLGVMDDGQVHAPGMLKKHYSPLHPLRLNALSAEKGELLLGFGSMECDLNLSVQGNLVEAAANLYRMLHELDQRQGYHHIAVTPIPFHDLGEAMNDRLKRAAEKDEVSE